MHLVIFGTINCSNLKKSTKNIAEFKIDGKVKQIKIFFFMF